MKRFLTGFGLLTISLLLVSLSGELRQDGQGFDLKRVNQDLKSANVLKMEPDFGKIPLYFIPNKGQVGREALFYAKTSGYTLWITKEGLVFDVLREEARQASENRIQEKNDTGWRAGERRHQIFKGKEEAMLERDVSSLVFLNANKEVKVLACDPTEHRVNYFIGNDQSQWRTNIPTSQAVLYKNIYKNIDLKVYGVEKQIEYDWVVRPGGKPEDIRFEYREVKCSRIDEERNLVVEGKFGEIKHRKPISYQMIDGKRIEAEATFKRIGQDEYGFSVRDYNLPFDLIIDPLVLVYSTYLGGSAGNGGSGIAVDSGGAVYITGDTDSTDFPAKNAYQKKNRGKTDAFVTKLSPSGKTLEYSTYLGGSNYDKGRGIAVDSNGAAYVTGYTWSTNFPTKNAYQNTSSGEVDAFAAKLSPSGKTLEYSTYLGGSYYDEGMAIAVDSSGAAYITGDAYSTNFPTKNAYQKNNRGDIDVFATKLSPSGKTLEYSTYLGGYGGDYGNGITVDSNGAAYITGDTYSTNFPTKNAYQKNNRGWIDSFIAKLSPSGKTLVYSTCLGGSGYEFSYGIAVDSGEAVYVTGTTDSTNFPTKNAYQKAYRGNYDIFVTKFSFPSKSANFKRDR